MTGDEEAFLRDPVSFFGSSYTRMHQIERGELEALQRSALATRFKEQRKHIPMLAKLADRQGVSEIGDFDDAVPLFFEQAMYKSYPPTLILNSRFGALTQWLDKLTSSDLSNVNADDCESVDAWLDRLQETTDLDPLTSPTGSGIMSFLPRNRQDWDLMMRGYRIGNLQRFGAEPTKRDLDDPIHTLWPTYADGHIPQFRIGRYAFKYFSHDLERYCHAGYDGKGSSDLLLLAARLRAAAASGDASRVEAPPQLLARRAEMEEQQRLMPARQEAFMNEIVYTLKGERVFAASTWRFFYDLAMRGLAENRRCEFAPDSVLQTGGTFAGLVVPDDWDIRIKEFFGVEKLVMAYGMTEVTATNWLCEHERYHIQPWLIPYVLDPDTSRPYPRNGLRKGRLALFDTAMTGHWGGVVSGDAVELDFDWTCPCGRQSPHMAREVNLFGLDQGGSDKITCAATPEIQADVIRFLADA